MMQKLRYFIQGTPTQASMTAEIDTPGVGPFTEHPFKRQSKASDRQANPQQEAYPKPLSQTTPMEHFSSALTGRPRKWRKEALEYRARYCNDFNIQSSKACDQALYEETRKLLQSSS
jgi:hypothetical protein